LSFYVDEYGFFVTSATAAGMDSGAPVDELKNSLKK
jgi:hypothetical protein